MSPSIREQLLQRMTGILAPVAALQGARLLRSPVVAIPREEAPALLLFPESDTISLRSNDRVERQLVVRLVALAREVAGEAPEVLADRLMVAAHAALFADANLGGLCLGLQELEAEWDTEDADAGLCAIPARYQITYRTLVHDLSLQG